MNELLVCVAFLVGMNATVQFIWIRKEEGKVRRVDYAHIAIESIFIVIAMMVCYYALWSFTRLL